MKPLAFIQRYDRIILWIAVAVLAYFLFAKPCNKNNSAEVKALSAKTDSLERANKAKDERLATIIKEFGKDTATARREAQDAVNDAKAVRKELVASQQTIYRLTAKLDKSKTDTSDAVVSVSPNYIENCDSLAIVALNQQTQIDDYTQEAQEAEKLLKYETKLRDDQIERERKYSDSLKNDFKMQTANAKAAVSLAEPKGRLLGGISVLGNENQFLSGAGVVLAYQSKGGKQYQISPKFIKVPGGSAEVFYEGSVLVTIFK